MTAGYEILEHTADIGIRSWGPSIASCFEQAASALSKLLAATLDPAPGQRTETVVIDAEGRDRGGLLVDFLNELIYLHESSSSGFVGFDVVVSDRFLEAQVRVGDVSWETATTGIKAATLHQLEIRDVPGGVEARVYLDV